MIRPSPWRTPSRDRPLLIAHRGLPLLHPENSAPALAAARAEGAEVVELDVRLTADGLLVVLHDETPERLTGDPMAAGRSKASELLALSFRDRRDEGPILLDEALALLAGGELAPWVDIEIKDDPHSGAAESAAALHAALQRAGRPSRVLVTSTSVAVLRAVAVVRPQLPRGLVFGSEDGRDPVAAAVETGARLIVANRVRLGESWERDARDRGLAIWCYTVNEPLAAGRLAEDGIGVITDDLLGLKQALLVPSAPTRGELTLSLDLGSTRLKAALVGEAGTVRVVTAAMPSSSSEPGRVEHDAEEVLEVVRSLLDRIAAGSACPRRAALATQRSSGLWVGAGMEPLTPVVSWRDERGDAVVGRLVPQRSRMEALADLPLARSWTAVLGRALLGDQSPPSGARLLPLGSWITARLTREPPRVDPGLANRMFLVEASSGGWSEELLKIFGFGAEHLPRLVPTVSEHGWMPWPGGGRVPLTCLAADQQAAFVGAVGPSGDGLLAVLGTGSFVMRGAGTGEELIAGARRAPIWTGRGLAGSGRKMVEIAVGAGRAPGRPSWSRELARRLALGDPGPRRELETLARAVSQLARPAERSLIVGGGGVNSPHLMTLLAEVLQLPPELRPSELTLLGAARLADLI